jgi:Protein of unknown function (DUF2924)/Protein of unknown function (DUF3320)
MTDPIPARVAALKTMPMPDLKAQWRALFATEPPPFNRRHMENRIAYRIQELAYGGLKPETRRRLEILGEQYDNVEPEVGDETVDIGHLGLKAPAYIRAELTVRSSVEPHEAPLVQLADLVARIVGVEGPIHIDEVARRITSAFRKSRAGSRIVEAARRAARLALQRDQTLRQSGAFLFTEGQAKNAPVRDRSTEAGSLLKAAYLPPLEIAAAAQRIREEGRVPPRGVARR